MPRFIVKGVDKESGLDTELVIDAESEANAKIKAELKGVIVTETIAVEDEPTSQQAHKTCKACGYEAPTSAILCPRCLA